MLVLAVLLTLINNKEANQETWLQHSSPPNPTPAELLSPAGKQASKRMMLLEGAFEACLVMQWRGLIASLIIFRGIICIRCMTTPLVL
jgi:hypothetical protein